MRKFFSFLIVFLMAYSCKAQTFLTAIDSLYDEYYDEYYNGSIPEAEKKAYELLQATTLYNNMLWAIGTGDATTAGVSKTALNTLLGTSYALPTVDFDETAQSYLDIDSLKIGSMASYVDSLVTWAGVLAAVSTAETDTALIRTITSDSVQAAITQLRSDISDSVTVNMTPDSSWYSADMDTLKLGTNTPTSISLYSSGPANFLKFKTAGVVSWYMGGPTFYSSEATGVRFPPTTSNPIRWLPNQADDNTGYSWASADKLSAVAGGQSVVYFYEAGTTEVVEALDSFIVNGYSNFLDSVYVNYAIDAEADEQWLALSRTGAVFADSITTAGFGLTDDLLPIGSYLADVKDGEISWYYKDENGRLVKDYSINGSPSKTIQQLQWGIEHSFRYAEQLDQKIDQVSNTLSITILAFSALCLALIIMLVLVIFIKK